MYLLELTNYKIRSSQENRLKRFSFTLAPGERCGIRTDSQGHAQVFLKALATFIPPDHGTYRFDGQLLDFKDYRHLLPAKRQIGYIAPDATLISNRSVMDNLLMMRYYFENRFNLVLDEAAEELCRRFDLFDKLRLKPAELNPLDFYIAIAIREIAKAPKVLLLERPENLIGDNRLEQFMTVLKDHVLQKLPIVFISYNQSFNSAVANRQISITQGNLTTATL
jgi:ABC-type iron transport system FetAB ATPase subunit